eukprot:gene4857-3482_t
MIDHAIVPEPRIKQNEEDPDKHKFGFSMVLVIAIGIPVVGIVSGWNPGVGSGLWSVFVVCSIITIVPVVLFLCGAFAKYDYNKYADMQPVMYKGFPEGKEFMAQALFGPTCFFIGIEMLPQVCNHIRNPNKLLGTYSVLVVLLESCPVLHMSNSMMPFNNRDMLEDDEYSWLEMLVEEEEDDDLDFDFDFDVDEESSTVTPEGKDAVLNANTKKRQKVGSDIPMLRAPESIAFTSILRIYIDEFKRIEMVEFVNIQLG